jgi:hypothetical protein
MSIDAYLTSIGMTGWLLSLIEVAKETKACLRGVVCLLHAVEPRLYIDKCVEVD